MEPSASGELKDTVSDGEHRRYESGLGIGEIEFGADKWEKRYEERRKYVMAKVCNCEQNDEPTDASLFVNGDGSIHSQDAISRWYGCLHRITDLRIIQ